MYEHFLTSKYRYGKHTRRMYTAVIENPRLFFQYRTVPCRAAAILVSIARIGVNAQGVRRKDKNRHDIIRFAHKYR